MTSLHRINLLVILRYLRTRVLAPAARAYVFAYLYITVPKLVSYVTMAFKKRDHAELLRKIKKTLWSATRLEKFPALACKLLLIINLLEPGVYSLLKRSRMLSSKPLARFISTLVASFVSSLVTFEKYQSHVITYGRHNSLDLTLLVATRGLDTLLSSALSSALSLSPSTLSLRDLSQVGDGLLFVASSTLIMFLWFFHPKRLPPAYRNWITSAAEMDNGVVQALKSLKEGHTRYGTESDVLYDYADRLGQPRDKVSFVKNQPLSCESVHAFTTKSCELHAMYRFLRGFKFAFKLYGTLNLIMLLIPKKQVSMPSRLLRALTATIRSSCFLGSFIALCWYGVCLGRTRLFPVLFPRVPKTRWDDTICVALGSFLSGFSCFVDLPQRRKELALFVAPRAVGTLISTDPTPRNLQLERIAFACSMAVLVAYAKKDAKSVRGIFGKGLELVFSLKSRA